MRRPDRVTGCVQAANDPSCTAQRVFLAGWVWIGQDQSGRIEVNRSTNVDYNCIGLLTM